MMTRTLMRGTLLVFILLLPFSIEGQEINPLFSDLPPSHPAYEAVRYLKEKGIISGYRDGTFQPERKVTRAEAVKIVVAPLTNPQQLGQFQESPFPDVHVGIWYLPYVEVARKSLKIIDGPPKGPLFQPEQAVRKVEFIKMVLLANRADPNAFGEIRLPLSPDVTNADAWYYPYLRYAVSSSMTIVSQSGLLAPGRELTRSDVALLLHRFILYREGKRIQDLLTEANSEIANVVKALDKNDVQQAEYASARALLAARGAHVSTPNESIVKGAVKVTEGFRALVRAYRAGINGDLDVVIKLAGDAWHLAARAGELEPSLVTLAEKIQASAKKMADSARALKAKQSS